MMQSERPAVPLLYVLCGALLVYVIGHWPALTNPYVINDDVRQQIFWMQQWNDPEIYPDDLLARYARFYVPWGVQAVYYAGSFFMNPVQFTKVVAGILYVVTAGFLFGLGLQFRNARAPIIIVCVSFVFTAFMRKITGGLAQSFGFPLLLAYLFFLARENLLGCALVILLESALNPYIFLLCFVTHAIYLSYNYGPPLLKDLWKKFSPAAVIGPIGSTSRSSEPSATIQDNPAAGLKGFGRLFLVNIPVIAGVFLMALKHVVLNPSDLGNLVTWAAMQGNPEYTAAGRYEFIPAPSFFRELVRPWEMVFPLDGAGWFVGWMGIALVLTVVVYACTRTDKKVDVAGFRAFGYLLPASVLMYIVSSLLFMKLFLPVRYLEFSLNVFYCILLGVCFTITQEWVGWLKKSFVLIAVLCVVLGGVRNYHVGIYDYSSDAPLYKFLETTPKTSLIAGRPELMDNCVTFARRKAFVTYELSHAWIDRFWAIIKKRTFDFFDAYYAETPEEIWNFARYYGIDYLVVREADFLPERLRSGQIYFEPFNDYIRREAGHKSHFAALDDKAFPVVFRQDGVRVLKLGP